MFHSYEHFNMFYCAPLFQVSPFQISAFLSANSCFIHGLNNSLIDCTFRIKINKHLKHLDKPHVIERSNVRVPGIECNNKT